MKKYLMALAFAGAFFPSAAQELYPWTEPASNMPSHSVSAKVTGMYMRSVHDQRVKQRYMPEVMFGLNKKWMLHGALLFSDMHEERFIWEGARLYGKYRFYSNDEVHRHFRMAAFAAGTWSRNHLDHNDINLMGDQSGVQGGVIATQLLNRWAFSATGSFVELLPKERFNKAYSDQYAFRALQYSLSAGVLLLPVQYKDYNQTNLNLYVELLGHRNLAFPREKYYVDLAPSIQLIFHSTGKLNLGYRFELASDIYRFSKGQFMISYEHIFLDALKRRKRR
ncbi:MAG: hypothetical protein EOO15_02110 [Chitinophagaceae bacterium]|nr:MAG: hypothetical protein EOO15_02110 [Chitinophagaceae bacterium]